MKSKTPATAEVSRGLLPSFSPANLSLSTLRAQHVANRYALPAETAAIIAALAFGGTAHG